MYCPCKPLLHQSAKHSPEIFNLFLIIRCLYYKVLPIAKGSLTVSTFLRFDRIGPYGQGEWLLTMGKTVHKSQVFFFIHWFKCHGLVRVQYGKKPKYIRIRLFSFNRVVQVFETDKILLLGTELTFCPLAYLKCCLFDNENSIPNVCVTLYEHYTLSQKATGHNRLLNWKTSRMLYLNIQSTQ